MAQAAPFAVAADRTQQHANPGFEPLFAVAGFGTHGMSLAPRCGAALDCNSLHGISIMPTLNGVPSGREAATLAGGCFWCLEAVYAGLRGVESAVSGYMGGVQPDPTYEAVCAGTTGHAEVVQVVYDPAALSYRDLLEVFFAIHDPTTLNRQGNDVGSQYRSAIFYHSPEQKRIAEEVIKAVGSAGLWHDPVVTEVTPATVFYPAESYHQEYFARNPSQPYCRLVVAPKIAKFRSRFVERLKKS
jgi:peptide-methionine (S)-S-oxide reductase